MILSVWSPVIALGFFSFIEFYKSMKNKFFIFIFLFFYSIAKSENLNIESKEIILDKNKNTSIFENKVVINTSDGKKLLVILQNFIKNKV